MERRIKMGTGSYRIVDDAKCKVMTQSGWMEEGKKRFGEDFMDWRFKCPMCGHIASVREFKEAGASDPNCAYQECIGRYTGKGSPKKDDDSGCNWAAYGLFGIPNGKGIIVIADDDTGVECFDFAEVNKDLVRKKMDILIAKDSTNTLCPNDYGIGWVQIDKKERMLWIEWGSASTLEKAIHVANETIKEKGYRKIYVSDISIVPHKVIDKVEIRQIN